MVKAKVIKKEWHAILAPKLFQNAVLGESYVYDSEQMIGKSVTMNLMNLTNDVKRQNININFKITGVQNGKGVTDVVGYYMVQSSIKRMIRKNIRKLILSFPCKTSDNKNLRIKPLLITRSATTGSVATKMRKHVQDFILKYVSGITYDNLINDLVNHKLQVSLRKMMNVIYPLRVCEIKSMEIVDLSKKVEDTSIVNKKEKQAKKAEKRAVVKESKEEKKPEAKEEKKPEQAKAEENKKPEPVKESKPEAKDVSQAA
jgi:ribosomal protein S3AE